MVAKLAVAEGASAEAGSTGLEADDLLGLYERMMLLRTFESRVQVAAKKGLTPGFLHLYLGQEAVAVGVCAHLRPEDWVTSTHRGHGHALAKGVDPKRLMAELYARRTGICGGRGGTMHLYDKSVGLFGTNGIVAAGISHAVGAALSARLRGTDNIAVSFFGDGAVNHGGFHESVNLAAVNRAPVVFVCENNLYATATPLAAATLNVKLAARADAYGIPGVAVDGNDVLAVWRVMREAAERARRGDGPTLIEAQTYRTVGHHEGEMSVGTYRTQEELDAWLERCPVKSFRRKLTGELKAADAGRLADIDAAVEKVVAEAEGFAAASVEPDPATVFDNVYAEPLNPPEAVAAQAMEPAATLGWLEAVRDGIAEEMRRNPNIVYLGEGTGERGGSFAHTRNLWNEFGAERMIDTPISEQGFTGAALGAAATGVRAVADLMFSDFLFEAAGQIVLQAAKLRYMSNGQMSAPMIVRAGAGSLRSAGPHHSGAYHPIWAHMPGLVVCVPSTPADAKGLFKTALRASDPVIMLESKALFASKGEVPTGEYLVPLGVARVARAGRDLTIVSAGHLLHRALEAATALAGQGIEAEVIDLRTIQPLDVDTVAKSVAHTHRLLVVDEGFPFFGVGAELGQAMYELAFDELDAPVARLHTEPTTHPFSPSLERATVVDTARIVRAATRLVEGYADSPRRLGLPGFAVPMPAAEAGIVRTSPAPTMSQAEAPAKPPSNVAGEEVTMPFGDLTVSEGKLLRWLKAIDETVDAGEIVAEVETDKAVVEIEAPCAGVLAAIDHEAGEVVAMGARLGVVTPQA